METTHYKEITMGKTAKKAQFSAEEKAAMKERARELKAAASKEEAEKQVIAKIADMPDADRVIAERVHAIVKANGPSLSPKTWYGMPAYANEDGKIVCFFKAAATYNSRYATLGFEDAANVDDGYMWPTSYALTKLTAADEAKIAELVKKAVS
jgi:uncharacterized protein YdhG (YjbR/CyaY superfamily)